MAFLLSVFRFFRLLVSGHEAIALENAALSSADSSSACPARIRCGERHGFTDNCRCLESPSLNALSRTYVPTFTGTPSWYATDVSLYFGKRRAGRGIIQGSPFVFSNTVVDRLHSVLNAGASAWSPIAWAVTGLAIGAAGALFFLRGTHAEPPSFQSLTFRREMILNARFAPDGKTVIYDSTEDGVTYHIYSVQPGNPERRDLGIDVKLLDVSGTSSFTANFAAFFGGELSTCLATLSM